LNDHFTGGVLPCHDGDLRFIDERGVDRIAD
jgi:hypothetical protein